MPADKADAFEADLVALQATMRRRVEEAYAARKDKHWVIWHDFCVSHNFDPLLRGVKDPIPYLQVFGARYRDGSLAPRGNPVAVGTISDAIRSVGQTLARMGAADPRRDAFGKIDFRLSSMYSAYRKEDPPAMRVNPAPVKLVIQALNFSHHERLTPERQAVSNMICIAFFFCLRPGEYTGTTTDDQAFALKDVVLFLGGRRLDNALTSDVEIQAATAVHLIFTTQKNGDKGEAIAHARSGDPYCCPVTAIIRQLMIHRREFRRRDTPFDESVILATYYNRNNVRVPIKPKQITDMLRWHAGVLKHVTGMDPASISARSLRAGGAMALLIGGCDSNTIRLLARWRSDAMMRYLNQQATPIFKRLAVTMFHTNYAFLPDAAVPSEVPQ